MKPYDPLLRDSHELIKSCQPLFKGKPPMVQGAALADMLAMWLAGHVILGDPKATDAFRELALKEHMKAVRALIPINYKQTIEPALKRKTQ